MTSPHPKTMETTRFAVRVPCDTHERVKYWADREQLSINEWVAEAIREKIARANGDYELPTLEQARLNQLIDEMRSMTSAVANLEKITVTSFEGLVGLTRGDNHYLNNPEDGELLGVGSELGA